MSNPFFNGDDVDDDEFLKNSRRVTTTTNSDTYSSGGGQALPPPDPLQQLMERKREIEQRTLESSNRSVGLLYESERTGQATAEELYRQKEQLKRTEARLDDINSILKQSERHLQGIKSIFGGIRNYFRGGGANANAAAAAPGTASDNPMPSSMASQAASGKAATASAVADAAMGNLDDMRGPGSSHPGLRVQGRAEGGGSSGYPVSSSDVNAALDRNLDEMSLGLSRLKGLAQNLNSELDEQSEIIDVIDDKVMKHGIKIQHQNREMNKILKK